MMSGMAAEDRSLVFLFDVDNTLLDNDRVAEDLRDFLTREFGAEEADEYFAFYEEVRREVGYADYLGALQRFRLAHPRHPHILRASHYLVDYPFANRLYPGSLDAIARCKHAGLPIVLSDGDVVFQPRKVERSGIWEAVDGHVLIYVDKTKELDDVEARYPARHYVMIDDKLRILTAIKERWGDRVTTVFPRQGHYANDPEALARYPAPDVAVERIGELAEMDVGALAPSRRS
jgi:FMN phosphatase YigB (HAD superfamily)